MLGLQKIAVLLHKVAAGKLPLHRHFVSLCLHQFCIISCVKPHYFRSAFLRSGFHSCPVCTPVFLQISTFSKFAHLKNHVPALLHAWCRNETIFTKSTVAWLVSANLLHLLRQYATTDFITRFELILRTANSGRCFKD